jgi:hypothetical protein
MAIGGRTFSPPNHHRSRQLIRDRLESEIGPILTDAFPFAGRRCERLIETVMKRLGFPPTKGWNAKKVKSCNCHLQGRGRSALAREGISKMSSSVLALERVCNLHHDGKPDGAEVEAAAGS